MYLHDSEICQCAIPMSWEDLTKIDGPHGRHIEQLWDEVKKLREEIEILKERVR